MGMRRLLAGVFVAALVFAACGGDDDDSVEADATTTAASTETTGGSADSSAPSTAETTPETTTPCPPLEGGTREPTEVDAATGNGLLTDVELTTGDCTDAVSFTFTATGDGPGYSIEYQSGPITQDGSGETIDVAGNAFLAVRFTPAYGFNFDTGQPSYTGPDTLTSPGAFFVQEVAKTGDFEGVVGWVIGLDEQRDYAVAVSGTDTKVITISIR
jgi:hypothetical protein